MDNTLLPADQTQRPADPPLDNTLQTDPVENGVSVTAGISNGPLLSENESHDLPAASPEKTPTQESGDDLDVMFGFEHPAVMPYNTDMPQMRMPEYGRKIHELIEYCKLIPEREERTACAMAIADVMARLFPNIAVESGDRRKIWDHINIMADFALDIDFPVEVVNKETLSETPAAIPYNKKPVRFRHYGRTLEMMIDKVASLEPSPEKDQLIFLIANQMKKQLLLHNKEGVSDARVLHDLADYSKGAIRLNPETYRLHEYNEMESPKPIKKKKRK